MIGKTTNGKGFGGTLSYCLDKKKEPEILEINNLRGEKPRELAKQCQCFCDANRGIGNQVWHTSLSFHEKDNVSKEQMKEIAESFLQKAGFSKENNQYVIIQHNDTQHKHIHIVANRVGVDGKAVSDSFSKSKTVVISKELEKEYNLTKVQELAKDRNYKPSKKMKVPEEQKAKETIRQAIDEALKNPKVKNLANLSEQLEKSGINTSVLKHAETGKDYGVSFKIDNFAFKGSELGKSYSFNGITKAFTKLLNITKDTSLGIGF
jgi:hypothetical protein